MTCMSGPVVPLRTDAPIYLDANILIYALESETDRGDIARRCLVAVDRGSVVGITSELTLVEVLPHPLKARDRKLIDGYRWLLGTQTRLQVIPIDRSVLEHAATIRSELGATTPDAIHVATALLSGCETFLTNDDRLRTPKGLMRASLSELALP
jgi:predicted nucleic acid-binding protein